MIEIKGTKCDTHNMLRDICLTKELRRLQDKTQMFNTRITEHFRTRLTHTIEVVMIAEEITYRLNNILEENNIQAIKPIDINLVKSIAFAHDIGHTPYGHAGEEKINDLLCKKGLLFKHNINTAKVLLDPKLITKSSNKEIFEFNFKTFDWRLFDGVIKHTSCLKSKEALTNLNDPYSLQKYFNNHPVLGNEDFINELNGIIDTFDSSAFFINEDCFKEKSFINNYINYKWSLSLEGQVVAIADEIAQRISDLDDSIRLYHKISDENKKREYANKLKDLNTKLLAFSKRFTDFSRENEYLHKIIKKVSNSAKYIAKRIDEFIKNEELINISQYKISKNINRTLVSCLILNIEDRLKKSLLNTIDVDVDFTNNKDGKYEYDIVLPIFSDGIICEFISFEKYTKKLVNILETYNKSIISDQIINNSNSLGKENIEKLFDIYKRNIKLVDTNTKRTLMFVLKNKFASFESLVKAYENKSIDESTLNLIEQIILEGIARMTDSYVEKSLNYYEGYKHYNYNSLKNI